MSDRDTLFASPLGDIASFRFNADVVDVFPDMITRSVPGYETIIAITATFAERYVQADSRCYDLGCSLGASTIAMRHGIKAPGCTIVAVDNSAHMIDRCKTVLTEDSLTTKHNVAVEVICGDILSREISKASMVVMNFTLQFIPPEYRQMLIQRIYDGLAPGGILVLSEKIAFADQNLNELMIDLHHAFKRANDYSELEISQKRTALENVLLPETLTAHRQRLSNAGFQSIDVWFQCFNFASLLAIK